MSGVQPHDLAMAELRLIDTAALQAELEWCATEVAELEERIAAPDAIGRLADNEELAWWGLTVEQRAERIKAELERRHRLGVKLPGAKYSRDWIRGLKDRIALHELIVEMHDGTQLKRSGTHYVGLCPFHVEQTGSLHVWPDHFHCFGCGNRGDVFDWLTQMAVRTFVEAVEYAAKYAGVALPDQGPMTFTVRERS